MKITQRPDVIYQPGGEEMITHHLLPHDLDLAYTAQPTAQPTDWWVIYTTDDQPGNWSYHGTFRALSAEEVLEIAHVPTKAICVHVIEVGSGYKFIREGWRQVG